MFLDITSEIYSWIRGAILILFIYHLMFFIQNGKKVFLYYSLYLLCFLIYFSKDIVSSNFVQVYGYLNFSIQFLGYAFYILFARELLNTKRHITEWDRLLVLAVKSFIAAPIIFVFIQLTLGYTYQEKLFYILAPIFSVFSILTYIVLTKIKGRHVTYFIVGSLIYLILANISFLMPFIIGNNDLLGYNINPMIFTYIGAILETTMFALIIGYTVKKFEERTAETEIQLTLKVKELSDLKMTVLQTQMDPHFLYNSLNSINNFVLQNDVEKASDYITKFSRLIREVLKNSNRKTIALDDDLGVLALYVKLEQMRMIGGFDYIVTIDENINLNEIRVPPLFLQPYIENAIWHGFANMKGDKRINLTIYDEGDKIRCEIVDNGVGIDQTKLKSKIAQNKRKPFGLKVSEDRIKLLYENQNVYVIIEDISDNIGTGTKVTLKFPKAI
jgi:sensor histidine kinase YesM